MGSKKKVAEAFASGRDAFVSFLTSCSSTFATDALPQHGYCYCVGTADLHVDL